MKIDWRTFEREGSIVAQKRAAWGPPRPTVPEVLPLVRAVYARHVVGCCLHILTDDFNVSDADATSCVERARSLQHEDCLHAAEALQRMTRTQRLKVAHQR